MRGREGLQAISGELWDGIYIKWIPASSFLLLLGVFLLACAPRGAWRSAAGGERGSPPAGPAGFTGSAAPLIRKEETCTSLKT